MRSSVERPNLFLEVVRAPSEERKRTALDVVLAREHGAGIVYASTVKTCEAVWSELVARKGEREIRGGVGRYHGELPLAVREATQKAFMENRYRVMIATKAFGMGVDKSDVRFVVHYETPESIESYMQEVGRAGRDGQPARATLLYRYEDRKVHDFFLAKKYASAAELGRIVEAVAKLEPRTLFAARRVADEAKVAVRKVEVVLHLLGERGVVSGAGGELMTEQPSAAAEAAATLRELFDELKGDGKAKAEEVRDLCESVECRWRRVKRAFGEEESRQCQRCDACDA